MKMPINIKRLIILTLITLLIIGTIIYFTADLRTLKAIRDINISFFLMGIFFYFLEVSFDAIRLKLLIRGTGHKIGLFESYKLIMFQVFFDVITPFSFGGQPFQIYMLHKKNIPGGSATTAIITKLFFGAITLMFLVIWAMFFRSEIFISAPVFKVMIKVTGGILAFLVLLFIMGLYSPRPTIAVVSAFFYVLWKLKISRHPDKMKNKIIRQLILAKESFDGYIGHRFFYFINSFFLSFCMILSSILMLLCFIWGFNVSLDLWTGIALTASLIFIITFLPTPGSSGLGEGVFYLLYKDYLPPYLIGVVIFLWRFFFHYISAFLGAFVTASYAEELLSRKKI
ncbi:MAG: lysylphosphatidylglycerol synthase transmembrane domain-containing protein [bacterium]|nr:lysylphosphatidylglycerol synthase transmembrane domain-containing protein [bacterium]